MLNFDAHRLSTGPNRTSPDSIRWKWRLTRRLPKTLASRFVRSSRAAYRTLRTSRPGSTRSSASLRAFSRLKSGVRPLEELSASRPMSFCLCDPDKRCPSCLCVGDTLTPLSWTLLLYHCQVCRAACVLQKYNPSVPFTLQRPPPPLPPLPPPTAQTGGDGGGGCYWSWPHSPQQWSDTRA